MTVRKTFSILALLALLALAGCAPGPSTPQTSATTGPTGPTPTTAPPPTATPTPKPAALELTFIGSDGNVWEMAWPGGTPRRLTSDAQANQTRYSGLAWSPDGSRLAVLRETGPLGNPSADTLVMFSPGGTATAHFTLSGSPYNTPFAWSSDGAQIAYRTTTNQYDQTTGDAKGRLTIIDSQTGATKKTMLYDAGGVGCGGAFPPVLAAVMNAHNAYQGLDTFAWTPGQQSILLSRGCDNNTAGLLDVSSQQLATGYPAGASYQPGGNLMMLGEWYGNNTYTLGLANPNGAEHSTLTSANTPQNGPTYDTIIGLATWSSDGQTVYYEHYNGIWSVGVDGSNAHQIIAGAPNNAQNIATADVLPSISPDGSLLLYLQLHGANGSPGSGSVSYQCYVAQPDGSNATALPQGASSAVWRP